jgi:hypothetical protein
MVIGLIIGIIILAIVIYIAIRIAKDIIIGIVLVGLIVLASFLILGSVPNLRTVPVIGPVLPRIPASLTEVISLIKSIFYEVKVLSVSRDSENKVLITIKNTGRFSVTNFSVTIDGKPAGITNKPKDPLGSGETTTIQTDWKNNFSEIIVKTSRTITIYKV